ncbi:MAG TPA: serine protein kinase PrkA, partial [Polyangiaceae bacterium]|nr:serine protein kinase PrkA [Polyangiaceae bacterium]
MSEQDRVARARSGLDDIHQHIEGQYRAGRRVLSFDEYLELFARDPVRHGRDASRYLRDVFDHYGTREVVRPWGKMTRYKLFDLVFEAEEARRREALIGQEAVQQELYRVLSNFAREGRANRLALLHGPNGSAKSTVVACMMRALEHYSSLDEGALYRFHWVFPSQKTVRGSIGFGGDGRPVEAGGAPSYAHLDESQIDARLFIEIRDHPLFLLPPGRRRTLLHELYGDAGAAEPPAEWLLGGRLAHKSQQVLDALLATYRGSLREALRHVQVERYFLSHRYRVGAVTIGPQMSVDAGERQITADRSLAALPTALQAMTMFEAHGELIEAQGGLLEYSDLLKRPIDTFKYLQISVETGEVALAQQNVHLNCVMVGSANEVHLDAFREHPEYPSFRGRFELLRAPYLLSYIDEQAIYDQQIVPQITKPVAPHVTRVAAMFAVLTRMRRPTSDKFPKALAPIVADLRAWEKMDLYATGAVPERLDAESAKVLRAAVAAVYAESDTYPLYEGRVGASPREMRVVLLNAAQSAQYDHLSPLAVLEEIEDLCSRRAEFVWLQEKVQPGGYHDFKAMRDVVRDRLFDAWEEEMRQASGLVEEALYADLFERYVSHVGAWVKGEKFRNRHTGAYDDPDLNMMAEVERLVGITGEAGEFRRGIISGIAAWAIDHPGAKIVASDVFPQHLRKMRAAVFAERRGLVAAICRDLVRLLRDGGSGLDPARQKVVREVLARLHERGYVDSAALDAASALVRWR